MTAVELRTEASALKIKNAWNMNKSQLIAAIEALNEGTSSSPPEETKAEAEEAIEATAPEATEEQPTGQPATEPARDEIDYTDCKGRSIKVTDKVTARVGNKIFEGTIMGLKTINDDQLVHVLLDGKASSKMFDSGDITFISAGARPEQPKPSITKKGGVTTYIAPEEPEEPTTEKPAKKTGSWRVGAAKEPKIKIAAADKPADGTFEKDELVEFTTAKHSVKAPGKTLEGRIVSLKHIDGADFAFIKVTDISGYFLKRTNQLTKISAE